jgi:hypothetical protein
MPPSDGICVGCSSYLWLCGRGYGRSACTHPLRDSKSCFRDASALKAIRDECDDFTPGEYQEYEINEAEEKVLRDFKREHGDLTIEYRDKVVEVAEGKYRGAE